MHPWVIPLCPDARRCGNKLATLARMADAGLPTPGGVAVTAAAFEALVPTLPGLGDPPCDLAGLHRAHAQARDAIRAVPWPPGFAEALARACPGGPLAVRSSAGWEDTPDSSAAGQLGSVIGVAREGLRDAVAEVWASAFSPTALTHRLRVGRPPEPEPIAVGVQPLVPAELSGVAYSAHPVTGDASVLVIEAINGLCGPLTDGRVVPAHLELGRTGRVLTERPSRQHVLAAYDPASAAVVDRPCAGPVTLPPTRIERIRHSLLLAEEVLGRPVDIEWSWGATGFVLLQARPIPRSHRGEMSPGLPLSPRS
ncbi:PEP/pyruvate-binding domain-containing protein [Actinomadura sp.]|uniref:PEP/pyruvate-binding domain-containing protein n=1 Tax=Actinomadura sp. TaxID=1989 RepID=UPI0037C9CADB